MSVPVYVLPKVLDYNPDTGALTWKYRTCVFFQSYGHQERWNKRFANQPALATDGGKGYLVGHVFGERLLAHRVVWVLVHGEWPVEIDHINGNRSDNRLTNLRNVTRAENCKNIKSGKGSFGVYQDKKTGRWYAQIRVNGKNKHLGTYATEKEAIDRRKQAEKVGGYHELHGDKS